LFSRKPGYAFRYEWRDWNRISKNAALAVVASEDQLFLDHNGFDFRQIDKALEARGRRVRGASTISQQVAKNLFLWPGRSFLRKGLEAWLTLWIELLWPKQRILEVYLNVAEWGDGVVYPHGIEQRFKAFHLDKVFPTLSDLSAASQRMQFTALKYQIEQMRRHPSIVGYVITEFTDVHWESNGLLDMCRNPKTYFDVIGQVNNADAIVPTDWERIAFWEGERCEVRLALSHFSSSDLRGCRLEWNLDVWPEVHGSFNPRYSPSGRRIMFQRFDSVFSNVRARHDAEDRAGGGIGAPQLLDSEGRRLLDRRGRVGAAGRASACSGRRVPRRPSAGRGRRRDSTGRRHGRRWLPRASPCPSE
jgi:hypothetical protein